MPSSPEISSEQGLKTTLEEGSPSADALEVCLSILKDCCLLLLEVIAMHEQTTEM